MNPCASLAKLVSSKVSHRAKALQLMRALRMPNVSKVSGSSALGPAPRTRNVRFVVRADSARPHPRSRQQSKRHQCVHLTKLVWRVSGRRPQALRRQTRSARLAATAGFGRLRRKVRQKKHRRLWRVPGFTRLVREVSGLRLAVRPPRTRSVLLAGLVFSVPRRLATRWLRRRRCAQHTASAGLANSQQRLGPRLSSRYASRVWLVSSKPAYRVRPW